MRRSLLAKLAPNAPGLLTLAGLPCGVTGAFLIPGAGHWLGWLALMVAFFVAGSVVEP